MTLNLGTVRPGSTILIPFHTFDSEDPSASVAIAAFVLADIGIYKGTSMTERASTTGVVLLETDGIDLDGAVGIGGFSIDLSSNATAGFYAAGSHYYVTVGPVTIDAAVINFVAATFSIGYPGAILNTTINVFTSTDNFTLNEGSADDNAYNGCILVAHDVASAIQMQIGVVEDYTGSSKTINLKADPGVFTMTAADHISIMPPALLPTTAGTTLDVTTTGAAGVDWGNVENKTAGNSLTNTDISATATVTNEVTADVTKISGDATAADTLELFVEAMDQATGQIDSGSFAAGAINAAAIAADAIGASELAADGVAEIADGIWDEVLTGATHNIVNSAGRRLRQIQEAGSYQGGAVFIDTVNGTAGTTDFENGVEVKPVKAIADVNTILSSLNLSRVMVTSGSSITFAATQSNEEFLGENWTLALGGQSVSGSHFYGADVTGTGTGASEFHFEHCEIGDCTLAGAHMDECDIEGTVTCSAASTYLFINCSHSGGTATIDFGSTVGNTTVHVHNYHGALTIANMGQNGTDVLHFSSPDGKLTLAASCTGGTVHMNGTFDFVNSGSGQTINGDGAILGPISELSQGVPAKTPTLLTGFMLMYMALRNKLDVATSGTDTLEVHNDAGTRIAQKLLTDDGDDYSEAKMTSGA